MLELLKAAVKVSTRTDQETLPEDILSFELEYQRQPEFPDIEAERARIAALLGADGFDLFAYSIEDDPEILILQFPGVERQQSASFLFQTADELVEQLNLVSATPSINPQWLDIEATGEDIEGVGAAIKGSCWADTEPPANPDWARNMIKANAASSEFGVSGAGIRIGQPDTGVAEHREIDHGIDKASGYNVIDNNSDPTDPLLASMGSPGHGTATSSIIVSRPDLQITGSAPGATIVPIRCVNYVLFTSGVPVAKAIDHARRNNCQIVTMSLGGPFPSRSLRRAIRRAIDADMIVMSAAGNCVGKVVFPARLKDVIAVAAVDENNKRWKGSSRGSTVDISAPGENVYVARRFAEGVGNNIPDPLKYIDKTGQGTSYAVALTAGCAALWLEYFGLPAVKAEARGRGINVQELFRAAIVDTAHAPHGWDHGRMGAGIVDARDLLALPLADIPSVEEDDDGLFSMLGGILGSKRHQAEASFVAMDWSLRRFSENASGLESAIAATPSPTLASLIDEPTAPDFPAPASIVTPATPDLPVGEAVYRMNMISKGVLEAAGGGSAEEVIEAIRREGTDNIMQDVKTTLETSLDNQPGAAGKRVQKLALDHMDASLRAMVIMEKDGDISPDDMRFGLEALVRLTGRPALRVGTRDELFENPNIGNWASHLLPTINQWSRLTDAVGRIDVKVNNNWVHAGTGFVVENGMVMTNRHVLDVFAEPMPMPNGEQKFVFNRDASIIFDNDAMDESWRFRIQEVVTAGGKRIGKFADMTRLDLAVLAIESQNLENDHPAPISFDPQSTRDNDITNILLAGYPARPDWDSAPDKLDAKIKYWKRIGELFGDEYGVKYMSPGEIMKRPGELEDDARKWTFSHDATTMPGNSGSAIISLGGGMNFCGIHFGGSTLSQNLAHDIKAVMDSGDGVFSTGFLNG